MRERLRKTQYSCYENYFEVSARKVTQTWANRPWDILNSAIFGISCVLSLSLCGLLPIYAGLVRKAIIVFETVWTYQKAKAVRAQEQHLLLATGERNFYNCCRESKDGIQEYLKVVDFAVEREPYSYDGTVHYSYDYAQQLHFPANPNQPGPIYFKTPWKFALFGVCCEAIQQQSKLPHRWKCTNQ